jgi:hypothetical protein
MITINFECGGCFAKTKGISWLKRDFVSVTGKPYGIGTYRYTTPQDVAPEGWIAFDPYTGCCYCPKCWAEIEGDNKNPLESDDASG